MLTMEQFSEAVVKGLLRRYPDELMIIRDEDSLRIRQKDSSIESVAFLEQHYKRYANEVIAANKSDDEAVLMIIEHLYRTLFVDDYSEIGSSFKAVKDRIYPLIKDGPVEVSGARILGRPYDGGMYLNYVVDTPINMAFVTDHMIETWGVGEAEIMRIAHENFLRDKDIPPARIDAANGVVFYAWTTCDGYDATRIILTERIAEVEHNLGTKAIIGIPNRDCAIIFPTRPMAFVDHCLARIVEHYHTMDHPITPRVFGLFRGRLRAYSLS